VRDRLKALERISRQLDPARGEREELLDARLGFAARPEPETGSEWPELLEFFRREVDTTGIKPPSPGQMGYIPGGGLYPSALGDYLADISNRYSSVAFAGPGAAAMELAMVDWMCALVGYPETAGGDLTSGGSIATLSALVTARDACGIGPAEIAGACIYMTGQVHHCVGKALHVAGLGQAPRRLVPMDARYRMDADALRAMIEADRARGLRPWLVVASAGTTDTGAIDPVPDIADIAQKEELWFHLDAAYGGFFLLSETAAASLQGLERADSIVMDPHKGLSLPYGSGAVLVRDRQLLANSNDYYADYMQDAKQSAGQPGATLAPADLSLELTRPFRGPRMWFPLHLFGLEPFRASLEEKIWLARYFHREISAMEGFEAGPDPDLSIVTYRYLPRNGEAPNDFNRRLLEAVLEDGRIFISSTMIDGRYTLRLAVLNFRTHLETVDYLLELLSRKARELDVA
jgi:glutamate/tyrosine decarboxylase-like PLP-dependent enzyme